MKLRNVIPILLLSISTAAYSQTTQQTSKELAKAIQETPDLLTTYPRIQKIHPGFFSYANAVFGNTHQEWFNVILKSCFMEDMEQFFTSFQMQLKNSPTSIQHNTVELTTAEQTTTDTDSTTISLRYNDQLPNTLFIMRQGKHIGYISTSGVSLETSSVPDQIRLLKLLAKIVNTCPTPIFETETEEFLYWLDNNLVFYESNPSAETNPKRSTVTTGDRSLKEPKTTTFTLKITPNHKTIKP